MVDLQGQAAAINGKHGEDLIEDFLSNIGIKVCLYNEIKSYSSDVKKALEIVYGKNRIVAVKQYPYVKYWGGKGRGDFFIRVPNKEDLVIEIRTQKVRGTTQEKFPELLRNCREMAKQLDTKNALTVVAGEGMGTDYLNFHIKEQKNNVSGVYVLKSLLELHKFIKAYLK